MEKKVRRIAINLLMKQKIIKTFFLILIGLVVTNDVCAQPQWDWLITDGTIVDGTGREAYNADILVREDSIGFIGEVDPDTLSVQHHVDASGKVVSPGFIDVHAHGNPLETPEFRNSLAMGVTTIVLGQDGSSASVGALDRWFGRVKEADPAVNIATLSGHGSIRNRVGVGRQEPSKRELRRMQQLLESDLEAGALGMSLGLEYVPGMYAGEAELQQLAKTVGEHNGIIMSHMRSEDNAEIKASLEELAALGTEAKVHASHLKVVYGEGEKRAEEVLRYINSFRKKGISITADVYPYTASYTGIAIVFPDWAKTYSGWKSALNERPDVLRRYLSDKLKQRNGPSAILFGSGKYTGLTLEEAARKEEMAPVELLLKIGPQSASAAHFVMDRELQDRIVTAEHVMISSDGSPGMRHPRGYGSFARIISYYVNEKEALGLEKAIYKMSGLPAQTLGLEKRGTIEKGNKADLLIVDPSEIRDNATFANPHKLADGFNWIMVNGVALRKNGVFNNKRYGRILKK